MRRPGLCGMIAVGAGAVHLATILFFGCAPPPPQPTFIPGDGGFDFGTLHDTAGNTYQVTVEANHQFRIDAQTRLGQTSFSIDEQGRLTGATTANGSAMAISYGSNGMATVSGTAIVLGRSFSFSGTLNPGKIAAALDIPTIEDAVSGLSTPCDTISAICEHQDDMVAAMLPAIRSVLIAKAGGNTGNAVVDSGIAASVDLVLSSYVDQARDFCGTWRQLLGVDQFPCNR